MNICIDAPTGIDFKVVPMTEKQYAEMNELPEKLPQATYRILQDAKDKIDVAEDWNGAIREFMRDEHFINELMQVHELRKNDVLHFLCGRRTFCC